MRYSLSLAHFLSSILFLLRFDTTVSSSFSSNLSSSAHLCAHDQSVSLLQFKESFSISISASSEDCQYPKTESWKEGTDCCLWDGVTCDMKTGQVTELNLACSILYGTLHSNNSLFSLNHLQKLDLSDNHFNSSLISSQFGYFSNLTHLNLSYSAFNGQVPSEISHLSKLVSLDLSCWNNELTLEQISFDKLVQKLSKLRELHLSSVNMSLVVSTSSLVNLSSSLSSLRLSSCGLQGKFPDGIFSGSNLLVLDLSGNRNLTGSFPPFNVSIALSSLDLSETGISIHLEHDLINNLKSVKRLYLSRCNFVGSNLALLGNLTQLTELDLSDNNLGGRIPSSMGKLNRLQSLNLGANNFMGPIPYDFVQLTELVSLDLSHNYQLCPEPISFDKLVQNLTKLRELQLLAINMSFIVPNSLTNLSSSLSTLDLRACGLQGKFPDNIFLIPNLESLDLSDNEGLTGSFPSSNVSSDLVVLGVSNTRISVYLVDDFFINLKSLEILSLRNCNIVRSNLTLLGNLTQLTILDLAENNLSGRIPSSLGNLVHLRLLYLDSNNFTGRIPNSLCSLTQLLYLYLSNNQLLGPIPSQFSALSNLEILILYNNLLNGKIPSFLFTLPYLANLDLHNNQFIGNISDFQYSSLKYLILSNNHLHGPIPSSIFKQENLWVLSLASNNKLAGEISSSICKLKFLQVLDLSNNSLSGSVPQCLGNFSNNLSVLHLGINNLQGTIPSTFSEGSSLKYLNLNGNAFEGEIPTSIINCSMLEFLDLGNNKIEDSFPYFLEMLPELHILVLKSNNLQGFVKGPTTNVSFSKLRIFDISRNNLSGPLPTGYFNSLEAMMANDQNMIYMVAPNFTRFVYFLRMTWKGLEIDFSKIQSTLRILDFSNNNFTGEIPKLIGKLKALQQLNLSHNSLTGHVQPSLGNLTNLESLDLSSNSFAGRIPGQLADLTFLGVLNLSYNQLEGPIPQGKQFNTFGPGSFEGNSGLCGFPMPKKCSSGEATPLPPSNFHEGDDSTLFEDGFGWKAVAMGYGCGFVFGVTTGYIMFKTRKPAWLLRLVEVHWNLKAKRTKKNARQSGARRN